MGTWSGQPSNQLSGEVAKVKPGTRTLRFARVGTGQDAEVKSELKAGRPVILEVPGHWIAAYGLDGDKILINDPYYRDRKTLDAYEGKVKSSVLFEASDDLSAVVITAPSNVRIRVTDKENRIVGTLNTGTPEDAKKEAQSGIPGASYSYRAAWRDPTCVESPPPPGAGTNQIILPGSKDDYKIEVLDSGGGPTSVAIHTYDKTGASAVQTADNPGPVVLNVSYDPSAGERERERRPRCCAHARPCTAEPGPWCERRPALGSPTPTKAAASTATGTATIQPTSTPTVAPTPAAPTNVTVACTTNYNSAPKNAVVTCTATIDGTFTSTTWTVNGVTLPSAAGKATASATFDSDANTVMSIVACNTTACRSGTNSVKIQFPAPTPLPSPTATVSGVTPTATPAAPVSSPSVSCAVNGGTVSCSASFTGDYTSIIWSSPKGSPPDASAGSKTYSFGGFTSWGDGYYTLTINSTTSGPIDPRNPGQSRASSTLLSRAQAWATTIRRRSSRYL